MKIKKGWKITWITLGSLLGLVLLLFGVAMWILFTPSQLTKLANRLVGNFLNCDAHFEYVDLTFVSTYPDAGLVIKDVTLVKKMQGAPSDTLAFIGDVTVGIDLMAFLKRDELIVHQVYIDNAKANLYVDKDGRCNFDIVPPSEDTTSSEPPALIDLKKVEIKNVTARFKSDRDSMDAVLSDFGMTASGMMQGKNIRATLEAQCQRASLATAQQSADVENLGLEANVGKKGLNVNGEVSIDGVKVAYSMMDSTGTEALSAMMDGFALQLRGGSEKGAVNGNLDLKVEKGTLDLAGHSMLNEALQQSQAPLLKTGIPFHYNLINKRLTIEESTVNIADVGVSLGGKATLASPMAIDVTLASVGDWRVKKVLSYIPKEYVSFLKKMEVDGKVRLNMKAKGKVGDGMMPVVDANINLNDGRYYSPSMLPYKFFGMSGKVAAHVNMNKGGVINAKIDNLRVRTEESEILLTGRADDLTGNMRVDASLTGELPLQDIYPLLPEDMELEAEGNAAIDARAKFAWQDLMDKNFDKLNIFGNLKVREANVDYQGLMASFPEMNVDVAIPTQEYDNKIGHVHVFGAGNGNLSVEAGPARLESQCDKFSISLAINDLLRDNLMADYDIEIGETEAAMDETQVSMGGLRLRGTMELDDSEEGFLAQFNPRFGFSTHNASFFTPKLPEAVLLTELEVDYTPELCEIISAQVKMGHTDLDLFGRIEDLDQWLAGNSMLKGYLNLTSEYSDVDQMMNLFSGAGSDAEELEAMRREDTVPADANPFIVPKNVDVTLLTNINRCVAFGNDLRDVSGELTVKDGVAVLDQMGFVCKAARMQLTALYKSPRPNNLFASIDFHLLDIQIDELLDMIPCIDTLVPMLKAFNGNADFHLAGETFLNARYQPKMSSLLGSAAISGKNLVVFEDKSLAKTAKLIGLKSWKDDDNKIKIDSLSVEMTCFRKEIEVYPFLLGMGKYIFCISGVHTLDNLCNYHIELLKNPLIAKIGVDIKGSLSDPSISLGSVRYGDFYKPEKKGMASKKALELKAMIRRELERNVR